MEETIFALATAQGKAGVAVVRLSGGQSVAVLNALGGTAPGPRSSRLCVLRDASGDVLDHALVLRFAEGASFTGEDVVELHLHGSVAIVRAVLAAIQATGLARLAEPGEFTRRALMNGRLDLAQVQGLADAIDAETDSQRRHAMRVMGGEVGEMIAGWRTKLVRAIALVEATIDFADEDVPEDVDPEVLDLIDDVRQSVAGELAGVKGATRLKTGFEVAIVGAPNAGKSSLLNALARSDVAIVSEIAGTTRDVIEVRMDINGLPVTFLDTAGLRDTTDAIERLGVERAKTRAHRADLRVFLYDAVDQPSWPVEVRDRDIVMRTKVDLCDDRTAGISSVTGFGLKSLTDSVFRTLEGEVADAGLISQARDREALESASAALDEVARRYDALPPEIASEMLRKAADTLQIIIGGVDIEAILDEVFSSFCLGK
ncbi:tRNA uridine-5-carboxymethylaminomethyl(34) synthesis GTPase MnmE [Jannaschia rubra]|uniref:tRNA uridine-5-carboxymethylaminomethyl(34) synthesis GTPase MnmE n=1 Tax=Jannaschia rubra TaxID=282197 RepID=UPI0024916C1D|nr:tRNA uridine-5-carboxymethylaminomethyl(34) synthesis GTPase MnmE [Jannaschia rubra]